jgi:hypothetical protein
MRDIRFSRFWVIAFAHLSRRFKRLDVLIYVHLVTRRVLSASCTARPTEARVTQQAPQSQLEARGAPAWDHLTGVR